MPFTRSSSQYRPRSAPAEEGRISLGAAFLLLLPLITLGLAIAHLRGSRQSSPGAHPEAPRRPTPASIDAWLGRSRLPGGAELSVSLTRLHGDAAAQEFDARNLGLHFGLAPGEPWNVEMRLDSVQESDAPLELAQLGLSDSTGTVLRPLVGRLRVEAGEVCDPLAVLFATPEELKPGETLSFVLWGGEPRENAVLRGFGSELRLRRDSCQAPARGSLLASLPRMTEQAGGIDRLDDEHSAGTEPPDSEEDAADEE